MKNSENADCHTYSAWPSSQSVIRLSKLVPPKILILVFFIRAVCSVARSRDAGITSLFTMIV